LLFLGLQKGKKEFRISKNRFIRINENIRFSPLLVIDEEGNKLGEISNAEAISLAKEKGLDLVEINSTSRPPVCKIMDFGRYKYELAKKDKENKAKQKETGLKEIRLTANIGDHDIEYKAKQARELFDKGFKIKVSMRLRGRENAFVGNAINVFDRFSQASGLIYESRPGKLGNMLNAMVKGIREESNESEKED
jgi:translation initiation factor IF-3